MNSFSMSSISPHIPHPKDFSRNGFSSLGDLVMEIQRHSSMLNAANRTGTLTVNWFCISRHDVCCRMKSRNGNIKKTQRSFNEQKIQIRIQKCLRLFRLRSSEKYKKKVCK